MPLPLPIHGDRFTLRDVVAADAASLAAIEFDVDVKRYLSIPAGSPSEWQSNFQPDLFRAMAIDVNGDVVGRASLTRAARKGDAELAIVIARGHWGTGLGRRVAQELIRSAFEHLNAKTLIGIVHPEHRASLALLRSFRFRRRGKK